MRDSVIVSVIVSLVFLSGAASVGATTLQSVYVAAGSGEGYDKLLTLDPAITYTGGITVDGLSCCIHGNGALIDLGPGAEILATGSATVLDVDHCVIINGEIGIHYDSETVPYGVRGAAINNTIYGNVNGIKAFYVNFYETLLKNNVVVSNTNYGIYVKNGYHPEILYNDVWDNVGGDHMEQCG